MSREASLYRLVGFLGSVLLLALSGACGGSGELEVDSAWARPAPASENGAVYFTITNRSPDGDALLEARGEVAARVELHRSRMSENGTMSMEPQDAVRVPAGEQVEFAPGGLHVMLIDLQADLVAGESIPLTLVFEGAGEREVMVLVEDR